MTAIVASQGDRFLRDGEYTYGVKSMIEKIQGSYPTAEAIVVALGGEILESYRILLSPQGVQALCIWAEDKGWIQQTGEEFVVEVSA